MSERLHAVGRFEHVVAFFCEDLLDQLAQRRLVFHHQDGFVAARHVSWTLRSARHRGLGW